MRGREAVWLWKKKRWRGDVVAEEEEEVKWCSGGRGERRQKKFYSIRSHEVE